MVREEPNIAKMLEQFFVPEDWDFFTPKISIKREVLEVLKKTS